MNGLIFHFLIHVLIIFRRIQHKTISQLSRSVKDTAVNSRLFTSIIWLARMHTARGTINDVLMKSHLFTFKGSIFRTSILSFNTLKRNSLTLFMSFVFRNFSAKVWGRCANFLHSYGNFSFLKSNSELRRGNQVVG